MFKNVELPCGGHRFGEVCVLDPDLGVARDRFRDFARPFKRLGRPQTQRRDALAVSGRLHAARPGFSRAFLVIKRSARVPEHLVKVSSYRRVFEAFDRGSTRAGRFRVELSVDQMLCSKEQRVVGNNLEVSRDRGQPRGCDQRIFGRNGVADRASWVGALTKLAGGRILEKRVVRVARQIAGVDLGQQRFGMNEG